MTRRNQEPTAPKNRADILQLAGEIRSQFDQLEIDDIAHQCGIVLARTSGPESRDAGFAYIEYTRRPVFIESLAHPEEPLRVWGAAKREPVRSIVINTNSGIPEREVFWHEYYHLFYSPQGLQRSERFEHYYSTEGALHSKEERRADEFAAAILASELLERSQEPGATISEIAERYDISERLVQRAMAFHLATQSD